MKVTRLKIAVLSFAATGIIFSGAAAYAAWGPSSKDASIKDTETSYEPTPLEPEPVQEPLPEPVNTDIPEPPKTVESEPAPEPAPAPVVRSYEEIVLDYPNMSTMAPGVPECASDLKREWAEYFQDHNREENIKRISAKFYSACSATGGFKLRQDMTILEHHFTHYGVR